eukprot:TRINITY_DN15413_c0_g1_i1.p1 TRINITY_DN15413_c0_g1~~TRINITY_DN15413_c0_g1_i1.p1  ORF type:complete len:101 (-),score=2.04 TRINITY_DN15413_c0_g1_i1:182-484(-)
MTIGFRPSVPPFLVLICIPNPIPQQVAEELTINRNRDICKRLRLGPRQMQRKASICLRARLALGRLSSELNSRQTMKLCLCQAGRQNLADQHVGLADEKS